MAGGAGAGVDRAAGNRFVCGIDAVGDLARDLCGAQVDLVRLLAQAPLVELQAAGLERAGLQRVGAPPAAQAVKPLSRPSM